MRMQGVRSDGVPKRLLPALHRQSWTFLILTLAGLGVSGYLSYVKLASSAAFCAGLGDCDFVQNSPYAYVAGAPVAYLGFAAYLGLLVLWAWDLTELPGADYAPLLVFGLALSGTLFSAYLTYVELFVIYAICIWCVVSALLITSICILSGYRVWTEAA